MRTRPISLRTLVHGMCLSLVALYFTTAAYAIEPTTIIAAAATAKEAAGKAKAFLEFIGYWPTEPDPMADLPEKLAEVQATLDQIEEVTTEILDIVRRLEEGDVRGENEAAFEDYLDALEHVTEARITLMHLAENPNDPTLRRDADVASRLALTDFETRPRMFRLVGPHLNHSRFYHIPAYAGYLQAVVVRAAYIQVAHGSFGFTHEPYRTELQDTAHELRELIAQVEDALEVRTEVFGDLNALTCTNASLIFIDHLLYDPIAVQAEANWTRQAVDFPGETCQQEAIDFYLEEPIQEFRTEWAKPYGTLELVDVAAQLDNYAAYGQPTQPDYEFPDWIMGSLYGQSHLTDVVTVIPDGAAVPGVSLTLGDAEDAQIWQQPIGTGVFQHESGYCLTAPATADTLTLEVCTGMAEQVWTRVEGRLQHQASGQCLSAEKFGSRGPAVHQRPRPVDAPLWRGPISPIVTDILPDPVALPLPVLHLAPCDPERMDQRWTSSDPTAGPIVR